MELNTANEIVEEKSQSTFLESQGQLHLFYKREWVPVELKASFPWTASRSHISVLNEDGELLLFIEELDALEVDDRQLVETAMSRSSFVFEVQKVLEVREEFELRHWKVVTRQGVRSFQTGQEAWPRRLPDGSYLVTDVSGDIYRFVADEIDTGPIEALLR